MKNLKSIIALLVLTVFSVNAFGAGTIASGTYVLCTSTSDLKAGEHYIIASGASGSVNCISNVSNSNNRKAVSASVSDSKITVTSNSTIMTFTLGGSNDTWTFSTDNYGGDNGYLASASSGNNNYCRVISTQTTATISFSNNAAVINLQPHTSRTLLRYNPNNGDPLFACYSSGQSAIYLYKKEPDCTAPTTPLSISATSTSIALNKTTGISTTGGNGGTVTYDVTPSTGKVENGVFSATATGTYKVTAHQEPNGDYCEQDDDVTITVDPIQFGDYVTQCCISPGNPLTITPIDPMKKNEEIDLEATGGNGSTIFWSTESNKIELTSTGHVKALGTGEAVVIARQEKNGDVCDQVAQIIINIIPASMYGVTMAADEGGTAKAYVLDEEVTTAETDDVVTITAEADEDYNFTGWEVLSGDIELGSTSETSTTFTMGSANVQIKAHFAIKQFTITLDAGNGTIEGGSTKELKNQDIHSTITLPNAVACNSDEWEFKGWATSSVTETTNEPTFVATQYEVTEDATLYAVYGQTTTVDGDYKYKIYAQVGETNKYMKGNPVASASVINQVESGSETEAQTYTLVTINASDNKYALKYLDNETVKYLCINTSGSGSNINYNIQGTETLTDNSCWIMSDGAKGGKIFTNVEHDTHGLIYRNADASKTYDVFKAYKTPSTKVTENGTEYYDLNLQVVGREQTTGGVWNSNPSCAHHYQVTYDGNGATTTCASEKLEEGEIPICADEPSLAGYTFGGWNDGTTTYAAGAKYNLTAPVTFTAVWNPIKIETITLNVTEPKTLNWKSDLASAPTFPLSVASTTPAVVADNSVTWSVSEGSAVSVSETGLVTAVEAGTATITATANDGSGVTASCTFTVTKTYKLSIIDPEVITIKVNNSQTKNQYFEANTQITLTKSVSKGYNFGEWVVKQGETSITITDGDKFTMPAAEVTVTATFTTKKDYYVDDMNDNAQIVMEGKYTVPSLPDVVTPSSTNSCEQTHLYFVGWIEGEIDEGQPGVPTGLITAGEEKTAGEKTYHAVWAEDANNNQ